MSSASSLRLYQALCYAEFSPLAFGTGWPHWLSPFPPLLSLSLSPSKCLSLQLSLFLFARVQWPTLPHNLPNCLCHPKALSFQSVSADFRPQCWQSSGPSEDRSNPGPPFCREEAQCGTKGQGLQFHSQAITRLNMVGEKNWHPRGCST